MSDGMFGPKGTGDTSGYGGLVPKVVAAGSSERPYGGYFDEVADNLERAYPEFSDAIERVVIDRGELTLHVKPEKLVEVAFVLRDGAYGSKVVTCNSFDHSEVESLRLYIQLKFRQVRNPCVAGDLSSHLASECESDQDGHQK